MDVDEGPPILMRGDRIFLVYAASGCWTDHSALGMLTAAAGSDLLDPAAWRKSRDPVFRSAPEAGVYAAGHGSFFRSPDGTEDRTLYHPDSAAGQGCGGKRPPRAQPITWKADGAPEFGRPVPPGEPMPKPSIRRR